MESHPDQLVSLAPEKLRAARTSGKVGNMTQSDLALAVGVHSSYIALIETGRKHRTSRAIAQKMASVLHVRLRDLLEAPEVTAKRKEQNSPPAQYRRRRALRVEDPAATLKQLLFEIESRESRALYYATNRDRCLGAGIAWRNLGTVYIFRGENRRAEEAFHSSVKVLMSSSALEQADPADLEYEIGRSLFTFGEFLAQQKRTDAAIDELKTAFKFYKKARAEADLAATTRLLEDLGYKRRATSSGNKQTAAAVQPPLITE